MPSRIDPFVDVLLREKGDQLYLLPEEPVTMVTGGKPRKVSKQPLTAAHIYALLVEVAPAAAIDFIDQMGETEFDYQAPRGPVHVRIIPENGRLTAVIAPVPKEAGTPAAAPGERGPSAPPPPRAPRPSAIAAAPMVKTPVEAPPPAMLPEDFTEPRHPAEPPEVKTSERRLSALLKAAAQSGASDLYLHSGAPPVVRAGGELKRRSELPFTAGQLEQLLLSLMPERHRAAWKETGQTRFAYEGEGEARFRVNAARDRKGPVAAFRVVSARPVTVEQLDIPQEVRQLCTLPKGLVVVAGSAASGKSSTLCAFVDLINRTRFAHIITIEDPIEVVHENQEGFVTQREVGLHTESFAAALRSVLCENPDVLLVSELRDPETVAATLEAAEAGRLVFAAMPTMTAAATVDRIIDRFPPDRRPEIRLMLSESLKGVVVQTLCKKAGGGHVAAREILLATPALANLIREGKTAQIPSVIQTGRKLGMIGLNDALLELVDQGAITAEEAYARAIDQVGLASHLKAKGIKIAGALE